MNIFDCLDVFDIFKFFILDIQFIKNYFGVNLLQDVWVDTGLLVHTVYEEGAFGFGNLLLLPTS